MNYPFKADIVTNPYSSWWASFLGPYFVNGEKVNRRTDCEDGTPTADEAFAKLPPNLKPLPAMTPIAEGFRPILEERHGERISSKDADRRMFIRDRLQHGPISKRGDRFEFMRYHRWYCDTAIAALCKQCGLNPETFGVL